MAWTDSFWWASNVAEWVGAIGTVGALTFAGFQIRAEQRSAHAAMDQTAKSIAMSDRAIQLQSERDQRDTAERESRQASRIACGTTHHAEALMGVHITVTNYSDVPIYDVHWFVRTQDGVTRNPFDPLNLAPGKVRESVTGSPVNRALLSGQFAGITFRDNAGRHWMKWGDGWLLPGTYDRLMELSPPDVVIAPAADPRPPPSLLQ